MIYKIKNFSIDINIGDIIQIHDTGSSYANNSDEIRKNTSYFIEKVEADNHHIWAHLSLKKIKKFSLNFDTTQYTIVKKTNLNKLIKELL
jgi:hypothetical protein